MSYRPLLCVFLFFTVHLVPGQTGARNLGNLKVFENGKLGFHTDLVNDGVFDENRGLVGFYSEKNQEIRGALSPTFYDLEIGIEGELLLSTSVSVSNHMNFIFGNIQTNRNDRSKYLQFLENTNFNGENDASKVNGYMASQANPVFTFPIGTEKQLRPFTLKFLENPAYVLGGYYFENPESSSFFDQQFFLDAKDVTLAKIQPFEFWHIITEGQVQITLSWNGSSNINNLVENLKDLVVTGWNKKTQKWENLGVFNISGNFESGTITSGSVQASDYEIYTLGSFFDLKNSPDGRFIVSPNGDGANDRLILEATQQSPNNRLTIFNRWGRVVFELEDYMDEFAGMPNKNIIGGAQLPSGIYYYHINLKDLKVEQQGYFFLLSD